MTSLVASGLALSGRLSPTDLSGTAGQLIGVVGPNGGGKTSLLRAIAGVDHSAGTVAIDGEDPRAAVYARRQALLSFLPASRDIAWPIPVSGLATLGLASFDQTRIDRLRDALELGPLWDRRADRLSTGERARVLFLRALAPAAQVLLLDEPLSNLDPFWVLRLLELFREEAEEGRIVLVALHDLSRLDRFDRGLLVANGKLQMDEAPADLVASERFKEIFRLADGEDGWIIRR